MTKIRCGDSLGIDLDRVIAWQKFDHSHEKGDFIRLYVSGGFDNSFDIDKDDVGCQAFDLLHKMLLDKFAIDLAGDNDIPYSEEGDDDGIKLEDLPF